MSTIGVTEDFYRKIKPRLHKRIGRELRLAGRVLDLGCGSCDLVKYLARSYGQVVTGVDVSGGSFPRRRQTKEGRRFRCVRKNARYLAFLKDASVDAVVSTLAFHEMSHPQAILAEAHRVLRPGGELLIVDFPRGSIAQELWNEDYYTPQKLTRMVADSDFAEVQAKSIERGQIMWIRGYRPSAEAGTRSSFSECKQRSR